MTRLALDVRGVVQGVGFRPFVRRAARAGGLTGWVRNGRGGVRIEIQGRDDQLYSFVHALTRQLPAPARIEQLEQSIVDERDEHGFRILQSTDKHPPEPVLPPDLATCEACRQELRDPHDRRHRYPFINCTHCGPRYSIIQQLPYDRPHTTMRPFALCGACEREYGDPDDRRYHAQPIACPRCGPQLVLLSSSGETLARGDAALIAAAERLRCGQLLALRGLGGYQLLADACNEEAVLRLRTRKQRPHKPFAVMFGSLQQLRRYAPVSDAEERLLCDAAAPITLISNLRSVANQCQAFELAPAATASSPWLGAMLATTPLHQLLVDEVAAPLVCTSGNLQDEPICTETRDALARLGAIADVVLDHDRPIARPVDDSLVRVASSGIQVLRRARGYAPLPVAELVGAPVLLGLGAHQKSTIALSHRGRLLVSQHLGDLSSPRSRQLLAETAEGLTRFYDAVVETVVCDLHPDYASTQLAEQLAQRWSVPLVRVQHHHAHVAAVMAEHGLSQGPVLGLAFDGSGFGTDGTIWGGEALRCEEGRFTRVAHLGRFCLPGGEHAVRSPRRAAFGLLASVLPEQLGRLSDWFEPRERRVMRRAIERGINAPICSSMGRLFDAVAALLELAPERSFEGHAAMLLEACALRRGDAKGYSLPLIEALNSGAQAYPLPLIETPDGCAEAALSPLLRAVLKDIDAGEDNATIALRFHLALVEMGVAIAHRTAVERVVVSGGCFANSILEAQLSTRLQQEGFRVYRGRLVPPGDNSISVGQIWIAAQRARQQARARTGSHTERTHSHTERTGSHRE